MNVRAVVDSLLEKDKNLYQEATRHCGEIANRSYMFDRRHRDAEAVKGLSQVGSTYFLSVVVGMEWGVVG